MQICITNPVFLADWKFEFGGNYYRLTNKGDTYHLTVKDCIRFGGLAAFRFLNNKDSIK